MVSGEYDPDASGSTLGAVHPMGRAAPAASRTAGRATARPVSPAPARATPPEWTEYVEVVVEMVVEVVVEVVVEETTGGTPEPSGADATPRSAVSATTIVAAGRAIAITGIRGLGRAAWVRSRHSRMCSRGTKSREGAGAGSWRASIRPLRRTRS